MPVAPETAAAETAERLIQELRRRSAELAQEGVVAAEGGAIPAAAWATIVPDLEPGELADLLHWLPEASIPEAIEGAPPALTAAALPSLGDETAARILGRMRPDDAADLIGALGPLEAERLLIRLPPADAARLRRLATYEPDTAGGIMTPAFAAVPASASVGDALTAIRAIADQAETTSYVYAVADDGRLAGVLSLGRLVLSPAEAPVAELVAPQLVRVRAAVSAETTARLLRDRNLLALPVVDEADRLIGIVTQDDVADLEEEESTADMQRLGGSQPLDVPYRGAGVLQLVRKRVGWLLLLFVAEAYTGTVLRSFESELASVVALSFFVPLLIGTGGNLGSQTVTAIVRALALGEIRSRDAIWILAKELRVAILLGVTIGLAGIVRAWTLGVGPQVGLVVGLALVAICVWAAMIAAVLPLLLVRLRIDPAVVSAPLITTLVDGTGLLIYLELARVILFR